jgi:hypothetical protein
MRQVGSGPKLRSTPSVYLMPTCQPEDNGGTQAIIIELDNDLCGNEEMAERTIPQAECQLRSRAGTLYDQSKSSYFTRWATALPTRNGFLIFLLIKVSGLCSPARRELGEWLLQRHCDWRHGIQRSSTADMEEESATSRTRNPTFLKILCTVKLSRNISAETLLSFSSRAIWTVRRSNSIPRPCFWH